MSIKIGHFPLKISQKFRFIVNLLDYWTGKRERERETISFSFRPNSLLGGNLESHQSGEDQFVVGEEEDEEMGGMDRAAISFFISNATNIL